MQLFRFYKGELQNYTILERDSTHMSLELGCQLMAAAFVYSVFANYEDEIVTKAAFDFFENLETDPVYQNGNCFWQGEFTDEIWEIIEAACTSAWKNQTEITNVAADCQTDPFTAKYEQVKSILKAANNSVDNEQLSETYLNGIFKSESVLQELGEISGLNIDSSDVTVTYTVPRCRDIGKSHRYRRRLHSHG